MRKLVTVIFFPNECRGVNDSALFGKENAEDALLKRWSLRIERKGLEK